MNRLGRSALLPVLAAALVAGCGAPAGFADGFNAATGATPSAAAAPVATAAEPPADRRVTAEDVVRELATLYPVPNRRDNTINVCGSVGCVQLITTDAVSVYEFPDVAAAQRFAKAWKSNDSRLAGRFVLSFIPGGTSKQRLTSTKARAAFEKRAVQISKR